MRALGHSKDRQAVPALLDALHDPELQDAAASALAEIGDPAALDALLELVDDPTDVSKGTIRALLQFDDPRIDALLIGFLRHSDEHSELFSTFPGTITRRIAAAKRAEDIAPLIEMLRTVEAPDTRAAIADALRAMTGQNFPMHYARWRVWHERMAGTK